METSPRARVETGFTEVYGVCVGRRGPDTILVATSKLGDVAMWRVAPDGAGVSATRIGGFALGSIAEGCVVDGAQDTVFIAQELVALWAVPLDDATGAARTAVDTLKANRRLKADLEGVALWKGPEDAGYLVVSVQGRSRFAVYDRKAPHAFRGLFRVGGGGVDGVSGTDGVAATSQPLGDAYPRGLLVVQDDRNTAPAATQDFKFVSWADVAAALGLGD